MTANRAMAHADRVLCRAAGLCLVHPDDALADRLPLMAAAVDRLSGEGAGGLRQFLDHARDTPPAELSAHYTEVFDFTSRHCLYLTWWTDGDTRRRGSSLVALRETYRTHGWEAVDPAGGELPDFLPLVLEFTAVTGSGAVLEEHRAGLELLRIALTEHGTPYRHVVDAVCRILPGPSPRDRAEARALARTGPPREEVGLAPYGVPPGAELLPLLGPSGTGGR